MPRTTTCLWFDDDGEEADRHYVSLFPNSRVNDVARFPDGSVLTVSFELDGAPFLALNGGPAHAGGFNEAFSVMVSCAGAAEVDHYWDRLGEGGEEGQCGWLKDRYGLSWQVVPERLAELMSDPDPAVGQRVMAAFMPMTKLDVAVLEEAARG